MTTVGPGGDIQASRRRPMHRSVLDTRGSVFLSRSAESIERDAKRLLTAVDPDTRRAGFDLLGFVDDLREAARQWQIHLRDRDAPGFGCETPKLSLEADAAESEHPPGIRLTVVQEVAERLGVSKQQVRSLCRDGQLSATSVGRRWLIDEESVDLYVDMKRDLK